MAMRWLPFEHDGPRTPAEAINDLRIMVAGGPRSEAHVILEPASSGEPVGGSGNLSLRECPGTAAFVIEVAGTDVLQIDARDIESSHLRTYDGADYYALLIETAKGTLHPVRRLQRLIAFRPQRMRVARLDSC